MRIIVNFQQYKETWSAHCLAEDARTVISPFIEVASKETLLRLLRYVGATDAEIAEAENDIRRWARGSVHVTLVAGRKNLLRIRAPWNEGLV